MGFLLRKSRLNRHVVIVGGCCQPLWKMMEFVSWDDDIPFPIPIHMEKRMFHTTNQVVWNRHQPGWYLGWSPRSTSNSWNLLSLLQQLRRFWFLDLDFSEISGTACVYIYICIYIYRHCNINANKYWTIGGSWPMIPNRSIACFTCFTCFTIESWRSPKPFSTILHQALTIGSVIHRSDE